MNKKILLVSGLSLLVAVSVWSKPDDDGPVVDVTTFGATPDDDGMSLQVKISG